MDIRRRVGTRRAVRLIVAVIGVACVGSGSREWASAIGTVAAASASGQTDEGVARLKGTVWVVNRDRGELAIFDVDTGNVLATRPVGAGAHDICISEQAGKAYISAETIGIVTTVDLETLAMESIPVGPLPHHLEPSHDGRTIYVSLASHSPAVWAPQYAAIDTDTNRVSYGPTSASAAARSHGPHPSLDGETLYVAHDVGDRVSAVDLLTNAISFEIPSIARAEEAIADPVRRPSVGIVAWRRYGQAHRHCHRHHHRLGSGQHPTRVGDAHALRTDPRRQPPGESGHTGLRRHQGPRVRRQRPDRPSECVRRPRRDHEERPPRLRDVRRRDGGHRGRGGGRRPQARSGRDVGLSRTWAPARRLAHAADSSALRLGRVREAGLGHVGAGGGRARRASSLVQFEGLARTTVVATAPMADIGMARRCSRTSRAPHSLVGTLARAGMGRGVPNATATLVLASNAPDLDPSRWCCRAAWCWASAPQ